MTNLQLIKHSHKTLKTSKNMNEYALPSARLLQQQAEWLAPARARALRKAGIGQRRKVLDLACGYGAVTGELLRRSGGQVTAFDLRRDVLIKEPELFAGAGRICGDALSLPFDDRVFDMVFCQFSFLWIDARPAIEEIHRVLQPQGVLVTIEPDYGGMIEYPPEIAARDIWINALTRAGADPCIGRKLPCILQEPEWKSEINLLDCIVQPSPERFALLRGLPLNDKERLMLDEVELADAALAGSTRLAHLPMFIVTAEKVTTR
jgi:SAM-dependent methyltransferase